MAWNYTTEFVLKALSVLELFAARVALRKLATLPHMSAGKTFAQIVNVATFFLGAKCRLTALIMFFSVLNFVKWCLRVKLKLTSSRCLRLKFLHSCIIHFFHIIFNDFDITFTT